MAYFLSMFTSLAPRAQIWLAAAVVLTVPLFCEAARAATDFGGQASFNGQYDGIADAAGMELSLQEVNERIIGRFVDGEGEQYAINGRRTGDTAQGALTRQGALAYFHMEVRPLGLQFLHIPRTPDGKPNIKAALEYSFIQRGVGLPETTSFEPPPSGDVDILVFAENFRKWSLADVARLYSELAPAHRTLLQLFDHASAELLWRVCQTQPPNSSVTQAFLTELLERQNTNCPAYLADVEAARASGLFDEFIRKADFQFGLVRETVKCDQGRMPEIKCADISALSGTLILRWRDAASIMRELGHRPVEPVASFVPERGGVEGAPPSGIVLAMILPLQRPGLRMGADVYSDADSDADTYPIPRINPRR